MSVLKLRRDMVVVDEDPVAAPVNEVDRPFPLRVREPDDADIIEVEVTDEHEDEDDAPEAHPAHKTFFQHVRFWFNAAAIVALLGAYPAFTIAASDVGDRNFDRLVNRADWSAPWVGGASALMQDHYANLGWASDAEAWEPMARLTAKPAYQSAMAGAIGDLITLAAAQATSGGHPDVDLDAAARLMSETSTGLQLRAARDALLNHDRRLRRRDASANLTPSEISQQLSMLSGWASASQERLIASTASIGGNPMDEEATRAVYAAKGQAAVALVVLDAMQWSQNPGLAKAREAALAAWTEVAEFHPLVVLNGDPDGSLFGNHPAAMSYLIARAEAATQAFRSQLPAEPAVQTTPAVGAAAGASR